MSQPRLIAILFPALLAISCHTSKKAVTSQYRLMDTLTVSANNNPIEVYRATSPRVWEIRHTDVALSFNLEQRTATGKATLTIQPNTIAPDTLVLDAKGMLIQSVVLEQAGASRTSLPFRYADDQLKIDVKNIAWGTITKPSLQKITIAYIASPYGSGEAGGSAAITEDRGLYFINTDHGIPGKPVQIWTQGETESNSHWLPTIDKPNQRTTLDIALTVPDTMQTLSNGQLISAKPSGPGLRTDSWRIDKPIQVYAIMFAIGHFDIAKDHWRGPDGVNREVSYYTEPAYAPYANDIFRQTPEMIDFFSKATGVSYPWNKYSQVIVRDYVSGAMENTSASLFGEFMNQNSRQLADGYNEDIISHELFHQWFGDYVTAESWTNLTLNESFATYGEQLWKRYKHGTSSSDELAYKDLHIYLSASERSDPPLVRFFYRDKEDMFDRVSYQKGASILHYINALTGDTLFNRAMNIYLTRNALQSAEASQWRLALEEATGRDWTQFFSQWYYRGGHPVLRVAYNYDDAAGLLKVTVRQKSLPDTTFRYNLSLKAAIITGNNTRIEDWAINQRTHTFTYPYKAGSRPLIIPDADHALPGIILEDKAPAQWLVQLTKSAQYTSKRQAVACAIAAPNDPVSLTIMETAIKDTMASIREYTIQQLARVGKQSWRDALTPRLKYILQTEGTNKVRAAALATLGAWEEKSALPQMVEAISDSSYLVAGSALDAVMHIDDDSAYHIAQRLIDAGPKGYLMYVTWTAIVGKGDPSDISKFEAKAPYVYGTTKTAFADNMQKYALATKDDAVYERTLNLLVSMARSENIRSYRYAIGSDVFELREAYKPREAKKNKDAAQAKARLKITEQYTSQILADEKDPANIKLYKEFDK